MRNDMKKWLVSVLVLALAVGAYAGPKGRQQVAETHDDSPAVWIHNTGSEKVTIAISEDSDATIVVTIGSTANTIDASGTSVDTISEFETALEACTNSSGATPLDVETDCVAATTESMDDELMQETVTIYAGDWGSVDWDTSDTKHYRVYIPKSKNGARRGGLMVKSVAGHVGGTGDITVTAYIDGTAVFKKVIESPIYNWSAAGTTETWASDDNTMGNIDIPLDIYVGRDESFMVSCDRATTGTTGAVMVRVEEE